MDYKLICVVAMAKNRVIGDGQDLLWHLPGDLKRVKQLTMGCPLIMGRRTWDSIGRPLPGRASIVLTRDPNWQAEGAMRAGTLQQAFALSKDWLSAQGHDENRIILFGGGEIYKLGLDYCAEIELTKVDVAPEADALFPTINKNEWDSQLIEQFDAGPEHPAFSYHHLRRKTPPTPLF